MDIQQEREDLRNELHYQAEWRLQKALEHPDDERNHEAARELTELSKSVANVPDSVIAAYVSARGGEDAYRASEIWSEMTRRVGFSAQYDSAAAMIEDFLNALSSER